MIAQTRLLLLLGGFAAVLGTGCWSKPAPVAIPATAGTAASGAQQIAEYPDDYPSFRKRFRTVLTLSNPSAQSWNPQSPPEGVKEIAYTSGDLELTAWVDEEALQGGGKKPAVLWLHSGHAFAREDWDQTLVFRDAGFHALVPILRGENGLPGTFSLLADELDDVLAAADRLARLPGVDPNQVFIGGHEVGGTLALLAALASDRFPAAATVSALPDCGRLIAARPNLAPFDPGSADEILLRSPLAFAAHFRCPVRVYFGSKEPDYVAADNILLAERARAAGREAEAVRVPGGLSDCVPPATKQAVEFFKQYRTGGE